MRFENGNRKKGTEKTNKTSLSRSFAGNYPMKNLKKTSGHNPRDQDKGQQWKGFWKIPALKSSAVKEISREKRVSAFESHRNCAGGKNKFSDHPAGACEKKSTRLREKCIEIRGIRNPRNWSTARHKGGGKCLIERKTWQTCAGIKKKKKKWGRAERREKWE